MAGELRLGDTAGPAAFLAVLDLGGEDFPEVSRVGAAFPDRDLRSRRRATSGNVASAQGWGGSPRMATVPCMRACSERLP